MPALWQQSRYLKDGTSQTHSQASQVDQGCSFFSQEMSEGDKEIILKHGR